MEYNKIFHGQRPAIGLPHRYMMTEESIKRCMICGVVLVMSMFTGTNCLYAQTASGSINGHDYVDLGLSVKWATCNVGAGKPSDYGNYYAWGETSTKSTYTEENSKTYEKNIDDIKGNSRYDVARANWGGSWRLPTDAEAEELLNKCKWTRTTMGGKAGFKVTGPSGNSIFLPSAGKRVGSSLGCTGEEGHYWTSTPYEGDAYNAYSLGFGYIFIVGGSGRDFGFSVRPVTK